MKQTNPIVKSLLELYANDAEILRIQNERIEVMGRLIKNTETQIELLNKLIKNYENVTTGKS